MTTTDHCQADATLAEAEAIERCHFVEERDVLERRQLNLASISADRGRLSLAWLRYSEAAAQFGAAADLVPAGHDEQRAEKQIEAIAAAGLQEEQSHVGRREDPALLP